VNHDPHTGSKAKWNRLVRKYRTVPTEDERMSRMLDALFPSSPTSKERAGAGDCSGDTHGD
jgi:hypothetical protein